MQLKNIDSDYKSEYLFHTCSVAAIPVKLPVFNPFSCATMLCPFCQTRNGSVTTHFILFSSTAMSSATGDYLVVPESFSQNEEQTSRNEKRASGNEERTRKKPSSAPKMFLNAAQ